MSGAVASWLSTRTHKTGAVSSIPPCVTFETPLARKATENHLTNSTSLEKTQSPVSGFCYARNRVCNSKKLCSSNSVQVLPLDVTTLHVSYTLNYKELATLLILNES